MIVFLLPLLECISCVQCITYCITSVRRNQTHWLYMLFMLGSCPLIQKDHIYTSFSFIDERISQSPEDKETALKSRRQVSVSHLRCTWGPREQCQRVHSEAPPCWTQSSTRFSSGCNIPPCLVGTTEWWGFPTTRKTLLRGFVLELTDLPGGVPSSHREQFPLQGAEVEEGPLVIEGRNLKPLVEARVIAVSAVYGRLPLRVISTLTWGREKFDHLHLELQFLW